MINNNKVYAYLAAALAILIPVPGRFAYGIFVLLHFNILIVLTTLLTHAIRHLELETFRASIIAIEIIALTVLFKQILTIFCPIASLMLGFSIYLTTVCSVLMTILVTSSFENLKSDLQEKMKSALFITVFCLAVFIFRDIAGFSTLTLPSWQNIIVINIPVLFSSVSSLSFIATIPGCLVVTALILIAFIKFSSKKNEPNQNVSEEGKND